MLPFNGSGHRFSIRFDSPSLTEGAVNSLRPPQYLILLYMNKVHVDVVVVDGDNDDVFSSSSFLPFSSPSVSFHCGGLLGGDCPGSVDSAPGLV